MAVRDFDELFETIREKVDALEKGRTFLVKDLFVGIHWNDLSKGDKLSFGRFFKRKVELGKIPGVIINGRAKNNSVLYKKTAK